jgi:glycosyltransferase involved in cell wall biosynthesis
MSRILMLCHDQHLDRRVLAQAHTLIAAGHSVHLLALAHDAHTCEESRTDGLRLTRIGLANIIPDNPTYRGYMRRQHGFNSLLNRLANHYPSLTRCWQRGFSFASRCNWMGYRAALLRYRNRMLHDPLPFRSAFVNQGRLDPSDLVLVHDLPALEAGVELAAQWAVPLAYDAHELYPQQKSFSGAQRRICADAEARLIQHAGLVFAVNRSIGAQMTSRYRIAEPQTLLNAIDPPASFDPEARYDLLREKTGLAADRKILLFQGGFSPFRNLELLIDAMARVRDERVALVMMGFGGFGTQLQAQARRRGVLGSKVVFVDAVPADELLQHSASADMGIIPYPHVDLNSYFCTPNKLFEFIQAGLPMLANDSPELNRFVRDNGFGMTRAMGSSRALAAAIDAAFASAEGASWKHNLREQRQRFSWQAQAPFYLEAIEALLAKSTDSEAAR